jgi:hypothetical protein
LVRSLVCKSAMLSNVAVVYTRTIVLISDSGDQQPVCLSSEYVIVGDVVCDANSVLKELAKVSTWAWSDCLEVVAMAEESALQPTVGHV